VKLKIISDGNPLSTRIENAETGEMVEGVVGLHISASPTVMMAVIELVNVELDLNNIIIDNLPAKSPNEEPSPWEYEG